MITGAPRVRAPLSRTAFVAGAAVLAATVAVPLSATPAAAAVPAPLGTTTTAARDFGNGGPRLQARAGAGLLAKGSDGAVVFYDGEAHQVRRVDPVTGTVTVLAGTGSAASGTGCALSRTEDATAIPLGDIAGLWTDQDGGVYLQPTRYPSCSPGDVYRLDANDHRWHLALTNPRYGVSVDGTYNAVAVTASGDLVVADRIQHVLRQIPAGAAPDATGTVIAGQTAPVDVDRLVVAPDGTPYVQQAGLRVSRVEPDGTLTPLAGTGQPDSQLTPNYGAGLPATTVPLGISALTVSADSATVYLRVTQGNASLVQAVPAAGGSLRTVAGPAVACGLPVGCLGSALLELGTDLLVTSNGADAYPTDGSAPQAPTRYLGIRSGTSPDGAPLSRAFLTQVTALAPLPGGAVALAGPTGIRTLSGLAADATLGTQAPVVADALAATSDGTLYAATRSTGPLTVARVSPTGLVETVLGGGSTSPADGVAGTAVALTDVRMATDPGTGALVFSAGSGTVFTLDGAGIVHRLGDTGSAVSSLAVTADHAVLAANVVTGLPGLTRVADGTATPLDCTAGCPGADLQVLANGAVVGTSYLGLVVRAPDGTAAVPVSGFRPVTALPDGRLVTLAGGTAAGGLLRVTDPVAVPSYADAPTSTVTAGPGRATVSVTPKPGVVQRLRVLGQEVGGDTLTPWTVADWTTDGSGTNRDVVVTRLGGMGTGLVVGRTYRFWVLASEQDAIAGTSVASAGQPVEVQPLPDTAPPTAPGLVVQNQGSGVSLQVTLPADDDLEVVVLRKSSTGEPLTSPTSGQSAGTAYGTASSTVPVYVPVDPLRTTTFAAFALDPAGNASAATTGTRPAATLVSGSAVSDVAFVSASGSTTVTWPGGFGPAVRLASGTTAPAGPLDGTAVQPLSGYFGTGAVVPLATGAKAALSMFSWADDGLTTYRRTSVVLTGGQTSDALKVAATPTVNPGVRPAVSVSLTRATTAGSHALAGQKVSLYRRTVGTSVWALVGGVTTDSTGVARFSVPVPLAATDYQARWTGVTGNLVTATTRTTVRQLVTATLSSATVHRNTAVTVRGALNPRRAARVYLQRYVSGRWVNVTNVVSSSSGGYSLRWTPTTAGTYTLRIVSPATSNLLLGVSPNRTLRVT